MQNVLNKTAAGGERMVRSQRLWLASPQLTWMAAFLLSVLFVRPGPVNAQSLSPPAKPMQNIQTTSDNTPAASLADTDMTYDTWIYPDAPNALQALQDGRHIDTVKAEFLHVNDDGTLEQINQSEVTPNGYSPANVAIMSQHSRQQYITVSGTMAGTAVAMQNSAQTIQTMVNLANKAGFGIELDWEEFGQWTPEYYTNLKSFLRDLKRTLHENGHNLMIDGPPIYDQNSQNWYQWKYEELAPLADQIVMMAYDNQYDTGAGNSIAPTDWFRSCLTWLRAKTGDKAVAGIASYGYSADRQTNRMSVLGSDTIIRRLRTLGSPPATRNSDGELTYESGGTFYDYSDKQTMDTRLRLVQESGITRLSVWSLGDNPWF
ncbi:MAG TPA: glycosyl hydrolase family 18 protein [Candidatus Saccharimonadales bacterium]|nr:glycosyl hydrolase family 18 protein [Candidatus Saccharimonadales bacterium]